MSIAEKTISFRADAEKIDTLDSLATAQDRPRSYLIDEPLPATSNCTPTRTRWFARGWERCEEVASSAMNSS